MGEDQSALRLCVLFQMTMPGAPCIYYGDEIGMTSAQDPFCRAAFPWQNQGQWDLDLLAFYRRAIALRQRYPILRTGTFRSLAAQGGVYAFGRVLERQCAVVIFNTQPTAVTLDLHTADLPCQGQRFEGVWNGGGYEVHHAMLRGVTIPARDAAVFLSEDDGSAAMQSSLGDHRP
jgi:neopullulanase